MAVPGDLRTQRLLLVVDFGIERVTQTQKLQVPFQFWSEVGLRKIVPARAGSVLLISLMTGKLAFMSYKQDIVNISKRRYWCAVRVTMK